MEYPKTTIPVVGVAPLTSEPFGNRMPEMATQIDMKMEQERLDPRLTIQPRANYYFLNDYVKIGYDDIFLEPEAIRTGSIGKFLSPRLKIVFKSVFTYTQEALFYFLSMIFGILLGFAWGTGFGCLSFFNVWCVQPSIMLAFCIMNVVSMAIHASIRIVLDPIFQSVGQTFAYITGNFKLTLRSDVRSGRRMLTTGDRDTGRAQEWFGFL